MKLHYIERLLTWRQACKNSCSHPGSQFAQEECPVRRRCQKSSSRLALVAKNACCARTVQSRVDFFYFEKFAAGTLKILSRERLQPIYYTMRGQYNQARTVQVDERHHKELVGSVGVLRVARAAGLVAPLVAPFIAIVQRSFIAVVAVSDDQFFIAHPVLHGTDQIGIGNLPDPIDHLVLVGELDRRG